MTLVINGTFAGPLLKKLGLAEDTKMRHRIVERYREAYKERVLVDFIHLLMDPIYQSVDFSIMQHHIPEFRDLTAQDIRHAAAVNKARTPKEIYREPDLSNIYKCIDIKGDGGEDGDKNSSDVVVLSRTTSDEKDDDSIDQGEDAGTEKPIEEGMTATEVGKSSIASTAEEKEELTVEMRKVYVELLRATYTKLGKS